MAETGWTAQVAAATGVAAGTGAAQLGLGYGLGVVQWPAGPADTSVWLGSLGWATWIAASSTVFGAVVAGRLGRAAGGPWRFALAASAAVGALLTVALIALPARSAVRTDTFSPQTIAGGYAVIGVLIGLAIAYWAVVSRPVAANLIATAAWLWSLAAAAVLATIVWHRPSATYLSSWQFVSPDTVDSRYGTISWPSAVLTLLAALVIGIIGALPAVRRGDLGVGAASSGAVGPLLVAAAFFVLAPQLTGTPGPLQSAYLIAPYAVLAGLAGSALTVSLGQRGTLRRAVTSASGRDDGVDGGAVSARSRGPESIDAAGVRVPAGAVAVPSLRPAGGAKAPASSTSSAPAAPPGSDSSVRLPRSTVAAPPSSPPVAKINDFPSGGEPPSAQKSSGRPGADSGPGPTDAASSDKAPPVPKNPANSTKAAPSAPALTRSRSAATPGGGWIDDSDTVELPVQDPKQRPARRTGDGENR